MSSRTRRNYDIISGLPDEVLCHILSFLPTQQAVATSVLSKRWTHLWRSVLHIDLTSYGQNQGKDHYEVIQLDDEYTLFRFNEFVYSVLLKLDSIKSFRIGVVYDNFDLEYIGFPSVVNWVNHVVQCGVESLYLTLFTTTDDFKFKFPVSILTCRTLVVLDFFGFSVEGLSSVRLPSLKILHFIETSFLSARDLVLLLAGCPNLEDLSSSHIEFDSEQSLTYQECESLDLRKLTVAHMPLTCCHFPLKALHNVAELHIEINKLYRSFDEIPTFHNLTKLKLHSINSNWDLLVQVLNHCPNLQNLELDEGTASGKRDYVLENWVDPDLVPQCLSLHLKTCKFKNFLGQQGVLMSARYILKNAKVLQTMEIYGGKGLKVKIELSLCPRASPTCELKIKANRRSLFAYQFL